MMMSDALNDMVEKLVKNGKADKTLVVAQAEENLLTRFAVNRIHQHVRQETLKVTVVVEKNKKVGIAGTSSLKPDEADALLDKALLNAELSSGESTLELAETGEQQFDMKSRFVEDLIDAHDERAQIVASIIEKGEKAQADAFGVLNATREKVIIRNSAGTNLGWQGSVGLVTSSHPFKGWASSFTEESLRGCRGCSPVSAQRPPSPEA